jgi:hypothetical protein
MTRKQRQDALKKLWIEMAISEHGTTSKFTVWQGGVTALLAYNPQLQAEFKASVKTVPPDNRGFEWDGPRSYTDICNILSQAINELGLPEEAPVVSAPILTDEHSILWFINHCSWGTRWAILVMLASLTAGAFFAGFKIGMMNEARDLYISFTTPKASQPQSNPTPAQPSK